MQVLVKILEMEFTDEKNSLKEAYLKANKWYASKILANERFNFLDIDSLSKVKNPSCCNLLTSFLNFKYSSFK